MQPCPELIELVLQNYENEASGEILEVLQTSYSRQEGVTVVGTDPNEWFEGFEAVSTFYESAAGARLNITITDLKAYCLADVGWTIDRVTVKLSNGRELPIRHTRIFQKEADGWKIVHNHISIAVPNERVGELSV